MWYFSNTTILDINCQLITNIAIKVKFNDPLGVFGYFLSFWPIFDLKTAKNIVLLSFLKIWHHESFFLRPFYPQKLYVVQIPRSWYRRNLSLKMLFFMKLAIFRLFQRILPKMPFWSSLTLFLENLTVWIKFWSLFTSRKYSNNKIRSILVSLNFATKLLPFIKLGIFLGKSFIQICIFSQFLPS